MIKYVGGKIKRVHVQYFKPRKKVKVKRIIEPKIEISIWKKIYQSLLKRASGGTQ